MKTLPLLLEDNWMICCSVKLNRTITGFQWLLVHKQRQCVGYICGGKWTVFESFYSIQFFGETVQLFSFWQKLCSAKSDFLVSPIETTILLVDPFYTTTFTLLDLQLHIFLVIRAIHHTKDLLLTHKISTVLIKECFLWPLEIRIIQKREGNCLYTWELVLVHDRH